MRKIFIVFVCLSLAILSKAIDPLPPIVKPLKTPQFSISLNDTTVYMYMGNNEWVKMVTDYRLRKDYVPYRNAHDTLITSYPIKTPQLILDTAHIHTGLEKKGTLSWDEATQSVETRISNDLHLNNGEELWVPLCINNSGADILNGQPVYINSALGSDPTIRLASNLTYDESRLIGVATQDIPNGSKGRVTRFGYVNDIDLSSCTSGGNVYLGDKVLTHIRPTGGTFPVVVGKAIVCTTTGRLLVYPQGVEYAAEVNKVDGWPSYLQGEQTNLSFTNATRTLSIAPVTSTFYFYQAGIKYIKTGTQTFQISDVEGLHFIYYNLGVFGELVNPSAAQITEGIRTYTSVSVIYWDATNKTAIYVGNERHTFHWPFWVRAFIHTSFWTQYLSGLGLMNITLGNGALDADAQFGVDAGSVADEDVITSTPSIASTAGLPIYYRLGAGVWRKTSRVGYSFLNDGTTGLAQYNLFSGGVWALASMTNNYYRLVHVFANNGLSDNVFCVSGIAQYSSATDAENGINAEINNIYSGALPFAEAKHIACLILHTKTGLGNTVNARFVAIPSTNMAYKDFRKSAIQGYGGGGSGSLTFLGLSDTPDSYAGQANKVVGASGLETGVEFKPVTIDGSTGVINIPTTATYNKGGVPIISQTITAGTTTLTASQDAIKTYADTKEPLLTKGNLTENITGLEFSSIRQVIGGTTTLTVSSGYAIPTTTNITHAESGYDNQITAIGVSGTTTKTITLTQQDTGTLSANFNVTKSDVGLSNVDNTSDLNKPISTAVQTALNGKENTLTKGNLTTDATGLQFDNTRQVIGGAAKLSLASGYGIPTTTQISQIHPQGTDIQAPTRVGDLIGLTQTTTTISIADKAPATGSTAYIWNTTTQQPTSNINISGNGIFAGYVTGTSFNSITGLASATPLMDGTATVGISTLVAKQDHIHPFITGLRNEHTHSSIQASIAPADDLVASTGWGYSYFSTAGVAIGKYLAFSVVHNFGSIATARTWQLMHRANLDDWYLRDGTNDTKVFYKILHSGNSNLSTVDWAANNVVATGSIQATTAKLTNLTDGYIPYHISDASGLGDSPIYTNGTNVGIGTNSPGLKLSVQGVIQSQNSDWVLNTSGTSVYIAPGTASGETYGEISAVKGGNSATTNLAINPFGGNVGIGYSTGIEITNNKLAVNGSGYFNTSLRVNGLAGTGTRLTTASSDGTLGSISNLSGFLKNDGSGNFSYTYPEITDIKATGSTFGYVPTSNGSGGLELRSPVLSVTSFIKQKSPTGIFNLAHSSVVYNNMLFVGERAANPKIVKFSNINDLSVYSAITINNVGSAAAGLETGFYVSSINKVCFIGRNNTAGFDIVEVDPNTMAYTQHNFASISGLRITGGTDGTYIYAVNYQTMYKIRVSDWTVVASVAIPANIQNPHSIQVNVSRSQFYLTGSLVNPIYMAIVSTNDLSYTQIDLSGYITLATDDMCFYDDGTTNKVFIGGESFSGVEPYCGVVVETTNSNALSAIHIKPSYGLFIDGVKVYSCSLDGYIQTFSALDPTNVSTFQLDGYSPNEVLTTSTGRTFLTHWNATQSVMAEFYVPVPMPDPTSAVTSVFGRTGAVVAVSGDYSAAQVTNAADKSTDNTFVGNLLVQKDSPYYTTINTNSVATGSGFRVADENGFYRGNWGYNNNTNETYFYNQFNDPYKFILNNVEQFRMNTSGVFETRNLSSAPTAARSGFGGFYTKNNLPYFINSSGTETQLGSASGSMVYPSGSGIPIVSGGVAWGTTIAFPGNTTQYLRADGTFATPTFTSQWTTDTYGITYANNVGIGVASGQFVKQTVLSNVSGYPVFAGQNTNANGHGAYIYGGSTSSDYTLRLYNYSGGSELFNVRGNGDIYAPNLQSGTTSYGLYYNDVTKQITWGAAGGGGGGSGTVTNFSSSNFSPLFTTSVSNSTTTPSLSFTAVNQAANLVFASPNGSTGVPSFRKVVVSDISATGAPSGNTYLRGDGAWGSPVDAPTTRGGFPIAAGQGSGAGVNNCLSSYAYTIISIDTGILDSGVFYGQGTTVAYIYFDGVNRRISYNNTGSLGSGITVTVLEISGGFSVIVTNATATSKTAFWSARVLENRN